MSRAVNGERWDIKSSVAGLGCVGDAEMEGGCRLANISRAPRGGCMVGSVMLDLSKDCRLVWVVVAVVVEL